MNTEPSLALYACRPKDSRGRMYQEEIPKYRDCFTRDRDRIIHSTAFRRLMYKTQVFINHEGDMYRTRLTHSLEVAQIGRSVARALNVNETLTETICLAHDLGHPPFGHIGQDALDACMAPFGGFEHNLQALRVVEQLECHYAEFPGLNLTFETREGMLKHCPLELASSFGELGERFSKQTMPSLEAQIADMADALAYNHHDIDDGLRSGLINIEQVRQTELFDQCHQKVLKRYPTLNTQRTQHETIRRMINLVVTNIIETSLASIKENNTQTIDDVRRLQKPLIGLSDDVQMMHLELKKFLNQKLYQHERLKAVREPTIGMLKTLFDIYMNDTSLIPDIVCDDQTSSQPRLVCDYIAGMTDRFAVSEYQRLSGHTLNVPQVLCASR